MNEQWSRALTFAMETTPVPPANSYNPRDAYANAILQKVFRQVGISCAQIKRYAALQNGTVRRRVEVAWKLFGR